MKLKLLFDGAIEEFFDTCGYFLFLIYKRLQETMNSDWIFCLLFTIFSSFHNQSGSFGKCFLTDYRPEGFSNMCQMLRVLNAVREYSIGIPLTYSQYPFSIAYEARNAN